MAKRSKINNLLIIALVLVAVMAVVILVGIFLPKPQEVLQGQAETSDYRISSKVPSRMVLVSRKFREPTNFGKRLRLVSKWQKRPIAVSAGSLMRGSSPPRNVMRPRRS